MTVVHSAFALKGDFPERFPDTATRSSQERVFDGICANFLHGLTEDGVEALALIRRQDSSVD